MNKATIPQWSATVLATLVMAFSASAMARNDDHQPPGHAKQHISQGASHVEHQHSKKVVPLKPHQAWKVGHQFPASYRAKTYRVYDYGSYHLSRPARNQHWYRINGDYVLVNVISHSILQIIAGR